MNVVAIYVFMHSVALIMSIMSTAITTLTTLSISAKTKSTNVCFTHVILELKLIKLMHTITTLQRVILARIAILTSIIAFISTAIIVVNVSTHKVDIYCTSNTDATLRI